MREELLAALAPREEKLELGGQRLVARELESAADVEAFKDGVDFTYKLIVRCTFGEDGERAFSDEDIPALKKASNKKLGPLVKAVHRVNGLLVEDEVKNSEAGTGAG